MNTRPKGDNATTDTGAISLTNLGPFVLMLSTNDSVFGKAGCNYYYGNYSFDGVQVTISIFGQTEMGCSKPYLLPLQTLDGTWTYILGDTVLILNRGNESRTFVSYYTLPLTNFPAVGATWVLTESNHPRFDEVRNATQFRVQIAPDRRMEIRWASVTNATDTNRVTGYFNRGENNGAFVHWWRWYYTGSWSPAHRRGHLFSISKTIELVLAYFLEFPGERWLSRRNCFQTGPGDIGGYRLRAIPFSPPAMHSPGCFHRKC